MEKSVTTLVHVNFRKGPSTDYAVIKTLDTNTVVQVTGILDGTTWYQGKLEDGTVGYISSKPEYVAEYVPAWLATAKAVVAYGEKYLSKPKVDASGKNVYVNGVLQTTYPYVFGSDRTTDVDFDCSDYQQWIFNHAAGIKLPWDSRSQSQVGTQVSYDDLRTGDLVFFAYSDGYIHHVAQVVKADPHTGSVDQLLHTFRPGIGVTYTSFAPGSYWRSQAGLYTARRVIA